MPASPPGRACSQPLGTTGAGLAALALGITATLAGGGILVIAILFVPEVRRLRRRTSPVPVEISHTGQAAERESA